ncbi:MAG TPA: hypothetical protein PKX07_15805 [Aggregatilineales bacterium]|jgi:hypothetical protein|nr:hypothetical protein [Aggregatilineales bacterium]
MRNPYRMMMTLLLCALLLVSVGAVLAQDEETSAEHDPAAAEQHTEGEAAAEGEAHDEEGGASAAEAEAHSAEAENLPQGMSWLVFLIGLGGILLVGLVAARGGPDGAIEDEVPAKQE